MFVSSIDGIMIYTVLHLTFWYWYSTISGRIEKIETAIKLFAYQIVILFKLKYANFILYQHDVMPYVILVCFCGSNLQ